MVSSKNVNTSPPNSEQSNLTTNLTDAKTSDEPVERVSNAPGKVEQKPAKPCAYSTKIPSRTPSRASQRSVTFSLHTPSKHEIYEEGSQFNPTKYDTASLCARRNSYRRPSNASIISNANPALVMYDQQPHSMMPTGYVTPAPYEPMVMPPPTMWYPAPPPPAMYFYPPPPPPIDAETMRKVIKNATAAQQGYLMKNQQPSTCRQFCCGGIAQMLWLIIAIVLTGCIAIVIVSVIYI